ncbi:hypothetical protein PAPHI01_1380 [Pancytospora philotis]|nr:hypothetical protein PAPHI01_1380 [Pancytospora philotis]
MNFVLAMQAVLYFLAVTWLLSAGASLSVRSSDMDDAFAADDGLDYSMAVDDEVTPSSGRGSSIITAAGNFPYREWYETRRAQRCSVKGETRLLSEAMPSSTKCSAAHKQAAPNANEQKDLSKESRLILDSVLSQNQLLSVLQLNSMIKDLYLRLTRDDASSHSLASDFLHFSRCYSDLAIPADGKTELSDGVQTISDDFRRLANFVLHKHSGDAVLKNPDYTVFARDVLGRAAYDLYEQIRLISACFLDTELEQSYAQFFGSLTDYLFRSPHRRLFKYGYTFVFKLLRETLETEELFYRPHASQNGAEATGGDMEVNPGEFSKHVGDNAVHRILLLKSLLEQHERAVKHSVEDPKPAVNQTPKLANPAPLYNETEEAGIRTCAEALIAVGAVSVIAGLLYRFMQLKRRERIQNNVQNVLYLKEQNNFNHGLCTSTVMPEYIEPSSK